MRLSDIPPDVLEQIQKFVREKKKEIPVTSKGGKTLVDVVQEKFGYRLSPSQIFALQKGERKYCVTVDVEAIRELEKEFGSVSKGVKEIVKFFKISQVPEHLRKAHEILAGKELTADEIEELLLPIVGDSREVWPIVRELSSYGFVTRNRDGKYVVHRYRHDPFLSIFLGKT